VGGGGGRSWRFDSKQNRPTGFGTAADRVKKSIFPAFGTAQRIGRSGAMAPEEPIESQEPRATKKLGAGPFDIWLSS
jgi:hypothetical protein